VSAYMVPKGHIDVLVSAARQGRDRLRWWDTDPAVHVANGETFSLEFVREHMRELTDDNLGLVGAMLLNENRLSVNHRYREDEIEEPYLFRETEGYPPKVVLTAISGYEYQACEHPGWFTSEARQFCESLRDKMCGKLRAEEGWEIARPAYQRGISILDLGKDKR